MSKLLKSELKEIVKECLLEILAEGLMNQNKQVNQPRQRKKKITERKKRSYLDNIAYNKNLKKKKQKLKTALTDNPIMNEILADTANSTLQEQVSAERNQHNALVSTQGDQAAKVVSQSDPESLFGEEAASKWASLAFS